MMYDPKHPPSIEQMESMPLRDLRLLIVELRCYCMYYDHDTAKAILFDAQNVLMHRMLELAKYN